MGTGLNLSPEGAPPSQPRVKPWVTDPNNPEPFYETAVQGQAKSYPKLDIIKESFLFDVARDDGGEDSFSGFYTHSKGFKGTRCLMESDTGSGAAI